MTAKRRPRMDHEVIDLRLGFVQLRSNGDAVTVTGKNIPWPRRTAGMQGHERLVQIVRAKGDSLHPSKWEMHPQGDELVLFLSGAADLILDEPGKPRLVKLEAGAGFVVPRGTWHRFLLREPGELLVVTPSIGTQLRDVEKEFVV